MKKKQSSLNNPHSSNDKKYNYNKKQNYLKNCHDLENKKDMKNNPKIRNKKISKIRISSPFSNDFTLRADKFDVKKIRKKIKEIIPEKDYHLIDKIITDKSLFPNNLTYEKGVFRDNAGNLLQLVYGGEEDFKIPKNILDIGSTYGLGIMSHNHMNGLVIPSPDKDIPSLIFVKSKYSPIYSPIKTGLLVNIDVSKNKKRWREIFNKYDKFFEDKKLEIQNLYPNETKKIRDSYIGEALDKKLDDDLHRPYFVNNQEEIVKEINSMFKENDFDLKLYIL